MLRQLNGAGTVTVLETNSPLSNREVGVNLTEQILSTTPSVGLQNPLQGQLLGGVFNSARIRNIFETRVLQAENDHFNIISEVNHTVHLKYAEFTYPIE